ncbi:Coq4 family protein [Novosphingopyxis sp. YJ-S2-01]|uniref:Coq4 family protein n=1 Tax=Novosphingopyxis sp. YJ-S2-01 TaxID=2794021 RepID=UPI001E62D3A8|nr:Coq4 family protein [Novosphingopyxis sp. YJ-S2-01]
MMDMNHDFSRAARPMFAPDRVRPRFRPFKAMRHFRNLIADKEDTSQVFHIFEALPRRKFRVEAQAFVESDAGRAVMEREPYLPDILDDHERLRAMPEGSVAHAYCDFMESEGLSAAGLVAEYDRFTGGRRYGDWMEWYANRNRDTHDLLHVLTGYGRDALGEQCVLAFTYGQNPAPANLFIAYAGGLNLKKTTKSDAPVLKAINEARKLGRACPRISEQSILDLLAEPLELARKRLNITPPVYYQEAHRRLRARGIDPYDLLAKAA